jgi:hypothetical protein
MWCWSEGATDDRNVPATIEMYLQPFQPAYIQKDSPGTDKEAYWLPAPNGPFYLIMRIYIPKSDTFNGQWKQPKLEQLK